MGWLVSDDGEERDARRAASSYKYGGRSSGGSATAKAQEQAIAEAKAKAKQAEEAKKAALRPIARMRPLVGQAIKVQGMVFQILCEDERVLLKDGKIRKGDGAFVSFPDNMLYSTETGWAHTPRRGCEEKAAAINALRSYVDTKGD